MHTVITSECTGCDLCVEPCPVDCIDMLALPTTLQSWAWELPQDSAQISTQIIASDREVAA
jgi:electron transport complex protein RnfB